MKNHTRSAVWMPILVGVVLAMASLPGRAAQSLPDEPAEPRAKLDRLLQAAVDRDDDTPTMVRVLVRATDGDVGAVRVALEALGHVVTREFPSIGTVGLRVRVGDLIELAAEPSVASVSSDGPIGPAPVRPGANESPAAGRRAVVITAVRGRVPSVLTDLRLHRDVVTHTDLDAHTIAANVHVGDVAVLARNPAIESIEAIDVERP